MARRHPPARDQATALTPRPPTHGRCVCYDAPGTRRSLHAATHPPPPSRAPQVTKGDAKGASCLTGRCPYATCALPLTEDVFRRFLPLPIYEQYLDRLACSFVDDNAAVTWCPRPGCGLAIAFSQRRSTVRCTCGQRFCFRCRNEYHSPCTCKQAEDWRVRDKLVGAAGGASCGAGSAESGSREHEWAQGSKRSAAHLPLPFGTRSWIMLHCGTQLFARHPGPPSLTPPQTSVRDAQARDKGAEGLSNNEIRKASKPCPKCGTRTIKNGGCMVRGSARAVVHSTNLRCGERRRTESARIVGLAH